MNNRELLTKVIKTYGLHADDVYIHKEGWKIIKRRGYKRIQTKLGLSISFKIPHAGENFAVVVATTDYDGGGLIQYRSTIGEASPRNSSFEYPVAVAQKRAEGKLILEIAELYQEGFMTEEEVDLSTKFGALIDKNEKVGKDAVEDAAAKLGLK